MHATTVRSEQITAQALGQHVAADTMNMLS
jgi:hypothetical protein